jgi:hypothetical protein
MERESREVEYGEEKRVREQERGRKRKNVKKILLSFRINNT